MPLYLIEISDTADVDRAEDGPAPGGSAPAPPSGGSPSPSLLRSVGDAIVAGIPGALERIGAGLLDTQFAVELRRFLLIVEADAPDRLRGAVEGVVRQAVLGVDVEGPGDGGLAVGPPAEVRLVGAELQAVRDDPAAPTHLVEWDLPRGLSMEAYLGRKRANAPRYAEVPETQFLRTYVREDMEKCLCFYAAPDDEAVCRAREAVDTPIDRISRLGGGVVAGSAGASSRGEGSAPIEPGGPRDA